MVKEVLIAAEIVRRELSRRMEPTWLVEPATCRKWNPGAG
jgi:hypothetical protein